MGRWYQKTRLYKKQNRSTYAALSSADDAHQVAITYCPMPQGSVKKGRLHSTLKPARCGLYIAEKASGASCCLPKKRHDYFKILPTYMFALNSLSHASHYANAAANSKASAGCFSLDSQHLSDSQKPNVIHTNSRRERHHHPHQAARGRLDRRESKTSPPRTRRSHHNYIDRHCSAK